MKKRKIEISVSHYEVIKLKNEPHLSIDVVTICGKHLNCLISFNKESLLEDHFLELTGYYRLFIGDEYYDTTPQAIKIRIETMLRSMKYNKFIEYFPEYDNNHVVFYDFETIIMPNKNSICPN